MPQEAFTRAGIRSEVVLASLWWNNVYLQVINVETDGLVADTSYWPIVGSQCINAQASLSMSVWCRQTLMPSNKMHFVSFCVINIYLKITLNQFRNNLVISCHTGFKDCCWGEDVANVYLSTWQIQWWQFRTINIPHVLCFFLKIYIHILISLLWPLISK